MSKTHRQKMAAQRQRYEDIIQGWRNDCDVAWGHVHAGIKARDLLCERLGRAEVVLAALVAAYRVSRGPPSGPWWTVCADAAPEADRIDEYNRHRAAWKAALDVIDPPKESP